MVAFVKCYYFTVELQAISALIIKNTNRDRCKIFNCKALSLANTYEKRNDGRERGPYL